MMLQLNCRGGTTFTQSTQSLHVCNMRCLLYDKTREVLFSKHHPQSTCFVCMSCLMQIICGFILQLIAMRCVFKSLVI